MNILFVNYGDFTSNSLNHIGGFANALCRLGHACAVAVPGRRESVSAIPRPLFTPVTFDELLTGPHPFPNGKPADIVHAWTPREIVRKLVLSYQAKAHARLIVHLEDNEDFLIASWVREPVGKIGDLSEAELATRSSPGLSHPLRYRLFLRAADGVTCIVPQLSSFVPKGVPSMTLPPGVDPELYRPQPPDPSLRSELGIKDGEKVVVFTGSNTHANEPEMRDLYLAVGLLNDSGTPTRLVRTGLNSPTFQESLPEKARTHVLDLGFVDKAKLPRLLALADVLVQPGQPGPFNDFRLPSKLPEFLSIGRPVVTPAANIGRELRDGVDAILLQAGSPEEIAKACRRVFTDPKLAAALGTNAVTYAKKHFDLDLNTKQLAGFYDKIRSAPARAGSTASLAPGGSEISLGLRALAASGGEAAAEAAEIANLVERLERDEPGKAERDRLEKERDHWQKHHELAKKHAANIEERIVLTDRQVAGLEERVRLTDQHVGNITAELTDARGRLKRLQGNLAIDNKLISASRQQLDALEAELKTAREQAAALDRVRLALEERLRDREHRLAVETDLRADRDAKIRNMQSSFSWQATAPLRFLRRQLIDPWKKKEKEPLSVVPAGNGAAPAGVAVARAPQSGLSIWNSVDFPQSWTLPPKTAVVRGWCFADDGRKLTGIRAVLRDRTIDGTFGFKRLDVVASVRDKPQAEYCGWKIDVGFKLDDSQISLETQDEAGVWHRFFENAVRVGEGLGPEDLTSYEKWTKVYDTLSTDALRAQAAAAAQLKQQPVISVIMPVYNTPKRWLRKAIDSVRAQTYPKWELCIADDASTEGHVRSILEKAAGSDPRIKVVFRPKNGHISAASNSAIELVTGDFLALLDHDDELAPNALFEVASAINARPEADYFYSDEDKIDEDGRRFEPYFKPDFLPDLFTSQNYLSHLSVYRTALVRKVGGFRLGFEGSQDWDLALRASEHTTAAKIAHIPRVLYHWRAIPGSTALLLSEKNYPVQAARRALSDHFARVGKEVELVPVPGDHWRVKFPTPIPAPKVALIIPTHNGLTLLRRCVESIQRLTTYPRFEIVIVDNRSDDPATLKWFEEVRGEGVRILSYPHPFNYSAINNFAVAQTECDIVGLLNNDLEVINPDWLEEMVSQASRPEVGCVGAMLYYPNDAIQHAGIVVGLGGVAGHAFRDFPRGSEGRFNRARLVQNYSAVTAACLVIRRTTFRQVGGFDEKDLSVAFNDVDFCLKVGMAGFLNVWTPFAELYHHESATRGTDDTPEKEDRFRREVETMMRRWGPALARDPAYNPNLTLELNDFSLASPPRR